MCPRCSIRKKLDNASWCRECKQEYDRAYYSKTKARRHSAKKRNGLAVRKRNRDFIVAYLQQNPCVDCEIDDIRVLEFDHVRGEKKSNVSDLARRYASLERLQEEIDKCDVRCANCHRIKTIEQLGWYTYGE